MTKTKYDKNDTMRIIGYQYPLSFLDVGMPAREDFDALYYSQMIYASKYDTAITRAMEFFLLGVMYGKKIERAKRNHKELKRLNRGDIENEEKRKGF